MSIFTKYVTYERNLHRVISKYSHMNITPILDYAIENNKSTKDIECFVAKKEALLNTYPNQFHSMKLSSINFCNESYLSIMHSAKKNNVKMLIDAENHAVQKTVDILTNNMIAHSFDKQIYKTYQMYRTDMFEQLLNDLEEYRRCNFTHNIKLVRGAYMLKDYDKNVLFENKPDTDFAYNECVNLLLSLIKRHHNINVIFATHNLNSFNHIKNVESPNVYHASLMGMDEQFRNGNIQKLVHVPFGPVHKTYPYLFRRMCENNKILDTIITKKQNLYV